MHDPNIFEDPMIFKPERFLKDGKVCAGVLDPEEATFGFGRRYKHPARCEKCLLTKSLRRICPGRHFSTQALMLMTTSLLACFDVKPPKDKDGQYILMEPMDVSSLIVS